MIDSSPRPLPQRRLAKLIHGLDQRMSGSLQRMAREIQVLDSKIVDHQGELQQAVAKRRTEHSKQIDGTTTLWDEAVHDVWDQAELRAFRAVFETNEKEGKLRKSARDAADQATDEAKKRIAEIEKRFMQAKDVPLKKLKKLRAAYQDALGELNRIESDTQQAIRQRSLRVPKVTVEPLDIPVPESADAALVRLREIGKQAQIHYERLANSGLARLFDSVWWWGLCVLMFVGTTAALTLTQTYELIVSVLIGGGATVAFVILGFLGVRPWLKRAAAAEYPHVRSCVEAGESMHVKAEELAVAENDAELKRLAEKRDQRFEEAKQWRDRQVAEITEKLDQSMQELREHSRRQKLLAQTELTDGLSEKDTMFRQRLAVEAQECEKNCSDAEQATKSDCDALRDQIAELNRGGVIRMQVATQKALQIVTRSRRWCEEHFPDWSTVNNSEDAWPVRLDEAVLPIGTMRIESLLSEPAKLDVSPAQLDAPVLFSPISDGYLVIHGDPQDPEIIGLVKNIILRALTTITPGRAQFCVVDPPGLGRDFGWMMHLGDFDPQLVSHRVWTQPNHITKQIETLARSAEDIIQQSLRNEYSDIVQYNRDAGALAEPFRFLIWNSAPHGLDESSWKNLRSLLDSGARCGIVPILIVDPDASWPSSDQRDAVMRRGLHVRPSQEKGILEVFSADESNPEINKLQAKSQPAPSDEQSQGFVKEVGRRALLASRVEVPLSQMVPAGDEIWQADSSLSLEIPIGQSGVGRTHDLKLGVGTAQHAIIAGKTGSGKSSLLHALITSAMLKYSPERLRIVLLDFKKGVEFQVYSEAEVPHADIIGIESHREFGLSALEYVDGCLQRRGEAFRAAGVQDVASWNAIKPDEQMPRMLVVVDEFQELFVEDDKLTAQASLILDRIVRQGRSFGVHAILSSQTLAGSYSLPRTTLGQMAVRIALQCDPSDAQIIFADDNPAASRLKHPGQAVYNDAGGRIEGNQPMQIGWLPKEKQVQWFSEWTQGYVNQDPTSNRLGRTVVYDGNKAATWSDENANLALQYAREEVNPDAVWCVTGESVAISPAVAFPLTRQAGRNILIVGNEDPQAASVINTVTHSIVRHAYEKGGRPKVISVQGAKPTDAQALQLPKRWKSLPCEHEEFDARGCKQALQQVHDELKQRMDDPDATEGLETILLNLIQIGRLRDLRREDEFGIGSFGESELTPDKQLEEILRDGPSYGIHVQLWAESYSTVSRWLSRGALREIEIRLLMQMSGNDSTNLIDNLAASNLGDHVMLLFDEATGQDQRFRPFTSDSLGTLVDWLEVKS